MTTVSSSTGPVRRFLQRLWHLHLPVVLLVRATPAACLQTLALAAKPSLQRLHLRDLFAEGRRYEVEPTRDGFRLTSTSKLPWSARRRTAVAATVLGTLTSLTDGVTLVRLRAETNWWAVVRGLLAPAWMSAIALAMPWPHALEVFLVAALFGLALVGHRLNAALQATDLVYFVETALDDLPAAELPQLSATGPEVVAGAANRDFGMAWERFYEEHGGA